MSAQRSWFSCAPSEGEKAFGPGCPREGLPGRPRDIPPNNLLLGGRPIFSQCRYWEELRSLSLSLSLSMRFPDRSPVLDSNRAPMGPEILSSTGTGAWRKAPMAFPDSSSVLDAFQTFSYGSFSVPDIYS